MGLCEEEPSRQRELANAKSQTPEDNHSGTHRQTDSETYTDNTAGQPIRHTGLANIQTQIHSAVHRWVALMWTDRVTLTNPPLLSWRHIQHFLPPGGGGGESFGLQTLPQTHQGNLE